MACWVVPTVAAELWECHIDRITNAIRDGQLKTKEEAGWMFVDVAPDSPVMETGMARWAASPWASAVVSSQEINALAGTDEQQQPWQEAYEPSCQEVTAGVAAEVMVDAMSAELMNTNEDQQHDSYLMHSSDDEEQSDIFMEDEQPEELPALHIADEPADEEALADFRRVREQVSRTRIAPRIRAA